MPVTFVEVPYDSRISPYEPYEVVEQTHQGFIYKNQITGEEVEIVCYEGYTQIGE